MPGVQKLQEVERLASANLAKNDSVWAMTQGRLQEVPDRHCRYSVLRLPGLQADKVWLGHLNLSRVLDEKDSLILRYELPENVQKRGLAGACSSADKDVLAGKHIVFEA